MFRQRSLYTLATALIFSCIAVAQPPGVIYYMNGEGSGSPTIDRTGTSQGSIVFSVITDFTTAPPVIGTVVPGTDINVGPGTPNNALRFVSSDTPAFLFNITVSPASLVGWEINTVRFDINTPVGVTGNYRLLLDSGNGQGFQQFAGGPITSQQNPGWRAPADLLSPTLSIFPNNTVSARVEFFGFTGDFDVDSLGLVGRSVTAIPEPASFALAGITLVGGGVFTFIRIRQRKLARRKRADLAKAEKLALAVVA
jgi:hypothetical protein